MSYPDIQINLKSISQKNTFCAQVFQCIVYTTHKCPLLQKLFLKWTALSIKEKFLLNYIAFHVVEKGQIELYAPIMQGFGYWSMLQDTEGACGYSDSPLDFKLDLEEEKRIFQIILVIDKIVSNISLRSHLCQEIMNFKIKSLVSRKNNFCSRDRGWGDNL